MTARSVALRALIAGGDAALALDRELTSARLDARERALATELAHGTLKRRRTLEWAVQSCLDRPFNTLDIALRWVLLLGAYQLLYLQRIPAHSAVDESVALARTVGHAGHAALTNAVLRRLARERPMPPAPSPADGAAVLGLYASLPDWIAAHLIERFAFERALRIAEGLNGAPRRALRVDLTKWSMDEAKQALEEAGHIVERGRLGIPECLIVTSRNAADRDVVGLERSSARHDVVVPERSSPRHDVVVPERSSPRHDVVVPERSSGLAAAFKDGKLTLQSEESQYAVQLLDPQPGETIIDVCAGRGVKTGAIAARLRGAGRLVAIDDDAKKLAVLARAGATLTTPVEIVRADARTAYPATVPSQADAVLVDAPCSGLGIIGRRADARWRKQPQDPARFAAVQRSVLARAAEPVRPGGRLLYVTCSTAAAEDEDVVAGFVQEHPEWRARVLQPPPAPAFTQLRDGGLLSAPGIDGSDGFFYALLERSQP